MENTFTHYGNDACFSFPYPEEITKKSGLHGMTMSIRDFWETVARDMEKSDPKSAAFYREVASHYPQCDNSGMAIERGSRGAILVDFDDWDDLTVEEKLTRGNINATIAALDRLRADLELMNDDPSNNDEIDEIRRALGAILENRY
ncbi:hypothetical protein GGQ64_004581 [Rhizobium azooxidifex]|uniref:Uncharacterized protein n=1 Tax=Mycoplana azooxidifex TaxID=1636188 RepID=A0A7W6D9V2_9HYPH|nr:hypothetical protein [Mycoplana azooxidifex]MBB3979341.1 hypothetical protein [Mycoplana azooxidifex]